MSAAKPPENQTALPESKTASHTLRRIALFAAFSMFAATLEYLFPRPVPFFRLGLANLPILLAFHLLDFKSLATLTVLKVFGQALVNGTLASYVFLLSFTGSFASFLLMYALFRILRRRISFIGLSLAGALASNSVQAIFSVVVIFGSQAWVILPLFYGLGFAAGLVIGVVAELVSRNSQWFYHRYLNEPRALIRLQLHKLYDNNSPDEPGSHSMNRRGPAASHGHPDPGVTEQNQAGGSAPRRKKHRKLIPPLLARKLSTPGAFAAGIMSIPFFLAATDPLVRLIQVVLLGIFSLLSGKRLLYTYFIFLMTSVIFFNLLVPQGRVLWEVGGLSITEGALFSGIYRGLTIIGLVFISLFSIRRDLAIPGRFGMLISLTLSNFERIYDFRREARLGSLVQRLDQVLYTLSNEAGDSGHYGASVGAETARGSMFSWPRARDWLLIVPLVASIALPLFISLPG